jgi:hypothetical protein
MSNNVSHLTSAQIKALYESHPDTNAYTDAEKAKLGELQTEITIAWDTITNKPAFGTAALVDSNEFATAAQGTLASTALQPSALNNYETTTQLNARDTANRDRANHTGTQPISSIADLSTTLFGIDQALGELTDNVNSKEPADATILKAADIGVSVMAYNAGVVIDPNYVATEENYTTLEKQKLAAIDLDELGEVTLNVGWTDITGKPAFGTAALSDIEDFATAAQGALASTALQPSALNDYETTTQLNARDTANRSRANHTGTQAISTVSGLQSALDAKQTTNDILTNISYLTGTAGLLRKNGASAWVLDTTNYLTSHPTISPKATNSSNTGLSYIQSMTFDANGHVASVTPATIQSATTGQAGVVQLNNTTSSTSTTQAATANALKTAFDLATTANNGLASKANLSGASLTNPTANTPTVGDSSTKIATTEFVGAAIAQPYARTVTTVGASNIQTTLGNYFIRTVSSNTTFTFSAPDTGTNAYSFTIEINHTGGTITWPASVRWSNNTAPVLTTGKVHIFTFVTRDNGTKWYGSASVNFNS